MKSKYRFVFATVFALIANVALFSFLNLLIDFKAPVQNVQASTSTTLRSYNLATHKTHNNKSNKVENHSKTEENKPTPINRKPAVATAKPKFKKTPNSIPNPKTTAQNPVQNKPIPQKAKANLVTNKNSVIETIESKTQPTPSPNFTDTTIANTEISSASAASNSNKDNHNPMKQVADKLASTVFDAKNLKKIYSPSPRYPSRAKRRNIQGWIITEFKIKKDGSVSQIKIIDGNNTPFFKKEVIKTLALWRFEKQYTQEITASMKFIFSLEG